MAHDVFISYSKRDKQVADALCVALESERIRCWLAPRDVQPGSDWASEIVKAVRDSRTMVLVFSEHSAESTHVRREITAAANAGVIIVPLKIDATDPTGAMQYYLADTHWLDALNPPTTEQIADVVRKVASLLEKEFDAASLVVPAPDKPRRRVPWVPIAAGAAVVAVLAGIGGYFALRGGTGSATTGDGSGAAVADGATGLVSSTTDTVQHPSSLPLETVDYGEIVTAVPADTRSVEFEALITEYMDDTEYRWLDFRGTWEGHEVEGTLSFDSEWRFDYIMVDRFGDVVFEGYDEFAGEEALQDPDYRHFYEVVGTSPIGAKLTVGVGFPLGDDQVKLDDKLTFDREGRLVKTAW
jgi:hypothetical protein